MINGVVVTELKQITDARGKVMHMLRSDSPLFTRFGEIYFSVVNPGVVKAWKKHFQMTQHIAVPVGKISLVLYDEREDSPSKGKVETYELGAENYKLIKIPPLIWYGFKGLSQEPALIANCTDLPHSAVESEGLDPSDARIPYRWL